MHTHHRLPILTAIMAIIVALPAVTQAQAGKTASAHETMAQLKAEAKVSSNTARATALALVPQGKVKSGELERENGRLLYSFDIATKGKSGIDEVQIDAITGAVLSNTHETPAMERAEAKADAKEHAAPKASKPHARGAKPSTKG
ncbi:MAG: PepSY domain-containing protein [Gemmatimonadaceae bacterium]|nr:PepSY domain-containing protein [Gemmatimonadaceae bacterium]